MEKRVLFIGNSHTYVNDMPFLYQAFTESEYARQNGISPTKPTMIVHGGRMLCEHIAEPEVQYNIKYGGYDYVVLQQAAHPFPGKEALLHDGKILCDWIKQANAIPVGYMTWAEKRFPENQQKMIDSYRALCAQNDGILAPVGAIWEKICMDPNADIELYYTDGEHASLAGSYLAACVIFAVIHKVSPIGLPYVLTHRGNTVYALEQEVACYLQQMTDRYLFG